MIENLPEHRVGDISPALELAHCRIEVALSIINGSPGWLDIRAAKTLLLAGVGDQKSLITADGRQGMISVAKISRNASAWTDFAIKLKAAAEEVGFSSDHGGKLLAAVKEFFSNVIEHSERVETGQVFFSAQPGRFEFVVRDRGIGILESLRRNPKYKDLNDGGSAIELALEEGVSRHAEEPGHGFGFRPVFIGLTNLSEYIRFRSGDHCREFSQNPDGSIDACTKQSSRLDGFSCTVICTPSSA